MEQISVGQLARAMKLENLTPEMDLDHHMLKAEGIINRPALQLAGFFEHFDYCRVQLMGNVEMAYLDTLDDQRKQMIFEKLFSFAVPCMVFCRGHRPDDVILEAARRADIPLLASERATPDLYARILHYVQDRTAPTIVIHGVLVDVFGEGVLITGESGIGKSETALELVKRGHRLVADDAVELRRVSEERLIGSAPEVTRHFIELRGLGIIDVKTRFGVERVKYEQNVDLVIRLEDWDPSKVYDRMGTNEEYVEYLGNKIICYSIPVRPGRNLAVIVESAAVNFRQKKMGYDAVQELYKRFQANMERNRK